MCFHKLAGVDLKKTQAIYYIGSNSLICVLDDSEGYEWRK